MVSFAPHSAMCTLARRVDLAFTAPKNQDASEASTSKQKVARALEQNGNLVRSEPVCRNLLSETFSSGRGNTMAVKDRRRKKAAKNCRTILKPIENKDFLAIHVPLQNAALRQGNIARKHSQNAVRARGKTAQNHSPRTGKHHGSEGRRRRKKGGEKLPNVTSETHRK